VSEDPIARAQSVSKAILERRSVKRFEDRPISDRLIDWILDLTITAPSSFNLQPWRIIVVRDPEQRRALRAASYNQPQFEHASATLIFAVVLRGWRNHFDQVMRSGFDSGAWPRQFESTIRESTVGFQEDLEARGLIREFAIKDAMIAATHAAIAAQSIGIASCFMNGWDESKVKEIVGVANDPDTAIAVILPLGYAAEETQHPGRLDRSLTVFRDRLD